MIRLNRKIKKFTFLELFIFSLGVFVLLGGVLSLAQEQVTITTYYPAPYGIYKELRADQLAVGSAYRNSNLSDGNLIISGMVGIGKAAPTRALDVVGNLNLVGNTSLNGNLNITGNTRTTYVNASTPGYIYSSDMVSVYTSATHPAGCVILTYGSDSGTTTCPPNTNVDTTLSGAASSAGGPMFCCSQ